MIQPDFNSVKRDSLLNVNTASLKFEGFHLTRLASKVLHIHLVHDGEIAVHLSILIAAVVWGNMFCPRHAPVYFHVPPIVSLSPNASFAARFL
jgi:hypothetical protein